MKAVIMAGGRGTRLGPIAGNIPKPMAQVQGKPILEYQVDSLKQCGIRDIILVIGHCGQAIQEYWGDGSLFHVHIEYVIEKEPLGTAGGLYYLKGKMEDDFILLFGDLILDVDWNRFMAFHKGKGAVVTLFGHPNSHPFDSDMLITDREGRVTEIEAKGRERTRFYHNLTNAGVYCVNPRLLEKIRAAENTDLERDILTGLVEEKGVYVYRSTEYVKDIGTPERFAAAGEDLEKGIVAGRNLTRKQKAVFLDRDGTINVLRGFLRSADDFELLPGVAEAVRRLNASSYLVLVATNQPVVARGECTLKELDRIHRKLETELGEQGAYVDDIFFCPHHPHAGFQGEVAELKLDCDCRKPKTGMFRKAAEKYNIEMSKSWYVGDSTVDVQTGANAGIKTVLVRTGEAGADGRYQAAPDFTADDLLAAVERILAEDTV